MNLNKVEKIIILVLVIGGILAAGFLFLIVPAYDGIGKAETNLKNAETDFSELKTRLERLDTIDADIDQARKDVELLEEKFYPDLKTYEAVEIILAQLKENDMDTLSVSVSPLSTAALNLEYYTEAPIIYDLKSFAQNAKEVDENEVVLMEGQFLDNDKVYTIAITNLSNIVITDDTGAAIEPADFTETMADAYKEAVCKYAATNKLAQVVSAVTLNFEVSGKYKDYLEFIDYLYNFERATYLPTVEIPMSFEAVVEDGKIYTADGDEMDVDLDVDIPRGFEGSVSVNYGDDDTITDIPVTVVLYGVEQIEELETIDISGTEIVTNQ